MATRKERNLAERLYKRVKETLKHTKGEKESEKKRYCINEILQMLSWSRVIRKPIKTHHIYVVTTMLFGYQYGNNKRSKDGRYHFYDKRTSPSQKKFFTIKRERTWGWFKSLKEAQEALRNNWGDMYEGGYPHAVICRVTDGILHGADIPDEWWYKWEGTWEEGKYKRWKKPEEYDRVMFSMYRVKQRRCHWGDLA